MVLSTVTVTVICFTFCLMSCFEARDFIECRCDPGKRMPGSCEGVGCMNKNERHQCSMQKNNGRGDWQCVGNVRGTTINSDCWCDATRNHDKLVYNITNSTLSDIEVRCRTGSFCSDHILGKLISSCQRSQKLIGKSVLYNIPGQPEKFENLACSCNPEGMEHYARKMEAEMGDKFVFSAEEYKATYCQQGKLGHRCLFSEINRDMTDKTLSEYSSMCLIERNVKNGNVTTENTACIFERRTKNDKRPVSRKVDIEITVNNEYTIKTKCSDFTNCNHPKFSEARLRSLRSEEVTCPKDFLDELSKFYRGELAPPPDAAEEGDYDYPFWYEQAASKSSKLIFSLVPVLFSWIFLLL